MFTTVSGCAEGPFRELTSERASDADCLIFNRRPPLEDTCFRSLITSFQEVWISAGTASPSRMRGRCPTLSGVVTVGGVQLFPEGSSVTV